MDYARENALNSLAAPQAMELLTGLGADLRQVGRALLGPCPLHGGDRTDALCVYPEGHSVPGLWTCRTRNCQSRWRNSLVGLVRGLMSIPTGNDVGWEAAARFVCGFVGADWDSLKGDPIRESKRRFCAADRPVANSSETWAPELVRSRLLIPSEYFVSRGYLPSTLDSFGVGESNHGPMAGRAVAPVFDSSGLRVAGVTGRSTFPRCEKCERWHNPNSSCPSQERARLPEFAKWRNNPGFQREFILYNFARALPAIKKTNAVILVEGPGDVWRLAEGGVENVVALMGVTLADPQQALIESTSAMMVIVLTDGDGAGQHAHEEIRRKLRRGFRLAFPPTTMKDAGSHTAEEIRTTLAPALAAAGGYST